MDRANNRPYYNPDSFNIGYSAVFRPGIGIVDPHNISLTDKLAIINKDNDVLQASSLGSLGRVGELHNSSSSSGSFSSNNNPVSLIQSLWVRLDTNLYSLLLRQFCLQPFQVAKLLLQLLSPLDKLTEVTIPQQVLSDEEEDGDNEEIDFFPTRPMSTSLSQADSSIAISDHMPSRGSKRSMSLLLKFPQLNTWSIISHLQQRLGIKSLWTSFQNVLIYDTLYPISTFILKRMVITPLLTLLQPARFVYALTTQTICNCIADFITESFILLPISLNHIKKIMFMGSSSTSTQGKDVYLFHMLPWDHTLVTVQGLTLLKVIVNNLYHHLFEFIIIYGINLSNLTPQERWIVVVVLNLAVDSMQLICKLPLESLINRFKWKYITEWTPSLQLQQEQDKDVLLFRPINVHSQEIWRGLWRGWRLHWVSRMCATVFKYLNRLDTDLEWERF